MCSNNFKNHSKNQGILFKSPLSLSPTHPVIATSLFNPVLKNHSIMQQTKLFSISTLLILLFLFFSHSNAMAQSREPLEKKVHTTTQKEVPHVAPFKITEAPKRQSALSEATYLQLDPGQLETALKKQPREFIFEIPQKSGKPLQMFLTKQDIFAPGFAVTDQNGEVQPYTPGNYYTGYVLDRQSHKTTNRVALSIAGNEVAAMISTPDHNLVLGALKDSPAKQASGYVFYNDNDLQLSNPFTCGSQPGKHFKGTAPLGFIGEEKAAGHNIVRVQLEADYQMYQDFGNSTTKVANYITALFNMVATIYHQENITTRISRIVVWYTPDPYNIVAGTDSGDVLNAFRARKNLTGITGDLAHLLSTKPLGHGGIAWIDVLCHPETGVHTAYSNISSSFNNFPLYSWTVDVVTHEMGHNLGSPHTHDCVWGPANNQALDNCAAPSGGCSPGPAPTNGGTIMSYCHLTAAGKNFNLGFGTQPGNLIRSRVNNATCLSKAWLDCSNATPIHCGDKVNGSTIGGANNAVFYGCYSWQESGPEKVYVLQTTEPGTITATLSNETADLDIILLNGCSESDCLAQGLSSVSLPNAPAGMYFIVVDGYHGAKGNFTLSVNCSGYCFATGLTNYEFIQRVQIGGLDHTSGNNYGYGDFTNIGTQLHRGGTTSVSLTPGFIAGSYPESWRIWVDLNQDEDFDDAGELVFGAGPSASTVTGALSVPPNALTGKTRMRVAMKYNFAPNDCDTFYGEVEDYTVDILPYCPSEGITKYEFIDQVEIKGIVNASGNDMGYADFTSLPAIDLIKGEMAPIGLTPGFTGTAYPEKWAVWIDFNNDFYFDDTKELVFSTTVGESGKVEGLFQVAPGAPTVTTRMRVVMYYGSFPSACNYSFYGETEDYLVNILPFCPSAGNTDYEYIQTVGIGSLLNDSGNDGGYADFTDLYLEATAGSPTPIVLVPGFTGSSYNEYWRIWIDLNKDGFFDNNEQVWQGGPDDQLLFGSFTIADTIANGQYGLRVAMRYGGWPNPCGNFNSGEVEDYKINILSGGSGYNDGTAGRSSNPGIRTGSGATPTAIRLYPNPAHSLVHINWNEVQPVAGQVISATGHTVLAFGQNDIPVRLDVSSLPAGLYTLQAVTTDKEMIVKKFLKVTQ